jgi:hypothetical protein
MRIRTRYDYRMKDPIDPKVRAMAEAFLAEETNPRALFAIRTMLKKGFVTTDDLASAGYVHTPRAIGDVRDAGIPVVTSTGTSTNGARQAVYSFGRAADIQEGRFGGRSAFSKAFKESLVIRYDSKDCITGATLDPKVLQIDHRVPYRVAGDGAQEERELSAYMLLDSSSQRAKSWACEHISLTEPPSEDCRPSIAGSPSVVASVSPGQI